MNAENCYEIQRPHPGIMKGRKVEFMAGKDEMTGTITHVAPYCKANGGIVVVVESEERQFIKTVDELTFLP